MNRFAIPFAFMVLAGCAGTPPPSEPRVLTPSIQRDLERHASFRMGTFESIRQQEKEGESTPVRLRVARPWPGKAGEFWFYLEYERVGEEGKPYWQRLVRATEVGGGMEEAEFELPDRARFVGAWKDVTVFDRLDPKRLNEVPGCRMTLVPLLVIAFSSGTTGTQCRGELPQGAHRVSDYMLTSSSLRAWDRAYDAVGKVVVWGSAAGPLEMRRVSQVPR